MANEYTIKTDEELKKKYQYLSDDTGIDSVADWALPNSSEKTNDDAVGQSMAKEDISEFVGTMVGLFKKINTSD